MEEKSIKETSLDIAKNINRDFDKEDILPRWSNYSAVSKFKSVRRAIRRGHVDLIFGIVYPNRPYSNKRTTPGRSHNQFKRKIYEQIKGI